MTAKHANCYHPRTREAYRACNAQAAEFDAALAGRLAELVRQIDTTRPPTTWYYARKGATR